MDWGEFRMTALYLSVQQWTTVYNSLKEWKLLFHKIQNATLLCNSIQQSTVYTSVVYTSDVQQIRKTQNIVQPWNKVNMDLQQHTTVQ